MKINIECLGQLGRISGNIREVKLAGDNTLTGLLETLSKKFGDEFRKIAFDDKGTIRPSLLILVNGVTVDKKAVIHLKDNDSVKILPAIAGG